MMIGRMLLLLSICCLPMIEGWQTLADHHEALWREVAPVQQRSLAVYEEVLQ